MHNDHNVEVRFADIDVMGHVNNAVYLSYFEQARMAFFSSLIGNDWDWGKHGVLLARNEVDYLRPVLLNDEVRIRTKCEQVGTTSLVFTYEVFAKSGNGEEERAARGKSVLVCFDYQMKRKIEVPEFWRERLT